MKFKKYPASGEIRAYLDYEPATGHFRWRAAIGGKTSAGKIAGCKKVTHYGIKLPMGEYVAARLAWICMHGEIPEGYVVDHIDGDRYNNSIKNLRLLTISQSLVLRKYSKKPTKNITKFRGRYIVQIQREHKRHFRSFKTLEDAKKYLKIFKNI